MQLLAPGASLQQVLAIEAICGMNQYMENLSFSLSPSSSVMMLSKHLINLKNKTTQITKGSKKKITKENRKTLKMDEKKIH